MGHTCMADTQAWGAWVYGVRILIHMHMCNELGWHGIKLVQYIHVHAHTNLVGPRFYAT